MKKDKIKKNRLKQEYRERFTILREVLLRHDPIRIFLAANFDEYDLEVSKILPKLRDVKTAAELRTVIHRVFISCFSEKIAGPEKDYEKIAVDAWEKLQELVNRKQGVDLK